MADFFLPLLKFITPAEQWALCLSCKTCFDHLPRPPTMETMIKDAVEKIEKVFGKKETIIHTLYSNGVAVFQEEIIREIKFCFRKVKKNPNYYEILQWCCPRQVHFFWKAICRVHVKTGIVLHPQNQTPYCFIWDDHIVHRFYRNTADNALELVKTHREDLTEMKRMLFLQTRKRRK